MARTVLPPTTHERVAEVIDRVLARCVAGGSLRADEVEDVRSAVMLRVLQRVGDGDGDAVRSVDDYVARMTFNAVNDVLRARRSAPAALADRDEAIDDSQQLQETVATRQMLELLWSEIRELPLMQRRALLLHVRDQNGGSAIPLLIFTGTATLDDIAEVLDYSRADIESWWDRLPMPDLEIAELVGLTRQQVITLRKSARERLERARRRLLRWRT